MTHQSRPNTTGLPLASVKEIADVNPDKLSDTLRIQRLERFADTITKAVTELEARVAELESKFANGVVTEAKGAKRLKYILPCVRYMEVNTTVIIPFATPEDLKDHQSTVNQWAGRVGRRFKTMASGNNLVTFREA